MKQYLSLFAVLLIVGCQFGGVKYAPGADPLVVQTETLEKQAQNGFDMLLHADQTDRDYFRTNAPGFHGVCEWLRNPISYHGTVTLARAQCVILQLDDVKNDYKASRATSNQLSAASSVLQSMLTQVQVWIPTILSTNK